MEVETLYQQLLDAWNSRNARGMADLFCDEGELIGFDGSQAVGPDEIFSHIGPIFENHPTPQFVSKIKSVRFLGTDVAILRAIAGMGVPPGTILLNWVNTHHTLVVVNSHIQVFQNTPAQFHGRPELVEQMTEELRQIKPQVQ